MCTLYLIVYIHARVRQIGGIMQSQRSALKVVYCSSWEVKHPPGGLEEIVPFTRGWQSERYCHYPQELILRLPSISHIQKIQLLSHHYMIASRVDLAVGKLPDISSSLDQASFTRLGYISLANNKATQFKSRELKSVNVDAWGQLVRLVLHHNHINNLNLYNQVALVAVNILSDSTSWQGRPEPPLHTSLQGVCASDPVTLGAINKPHIQVTDDLAFSMSQDPEIAELIRKLYLEKSKAVEDERYEYAKTLKQIIVELQKIGEVLCRYEVEKRCAVDMEDYDTARRKKLKSDTLRGQVYKQLSILHSQSSHQLIPATVYPHLTLPSVDTHSCTKRTGSHNVPSPHFPPIIPPLPSPKPPTGTYDEVPLPALVNRSNQMTFDEDYSSEDRGEREELRSLTRKEMAKVSNALEVFGMDKVKLLFAKQFSVRERGLRTVREALSSLTSCPRGETSVWVRGAAELLGRALKDDVFSCFTLSVELLKYLLDTFCTNHKLGQQEVSMLLDKTYPIILERTGESSPRIVSTAVQSAMDIAKLDKVKSTAIIGQHLIKPVKLGNWRLLRSHVTLLSGILFDVYTDSRDSGLSIEGVMKFLCPCLEHSNGQVRECAVKLTLDLYKQYGSSICRWLPVKESSPERRKGFWKSLYDRFEQSTTIHHPPQRTITSHTHQQQTNKDQQTHDFKLRRLQAQTVALTNLSKAGKKVSRAELSELLSKATAAIPASQLINNSGVSLRPERAETLGKTCVFCGEKREEFTFEGLETHYRRECLLLHLCKYCSQVVELSSLTTHLLSQCTQKRRFQQCPRCKQAVLIEHYSSHSEARDCVDIEAEGRGEVGCAGRVCPLCYNNISFGDEIPEKQMYNSRILYN